MHIVLREIKSRTTEYIQPVQQFHLCTRARTSVQTQILSVCREMLYRIVTRVAQSGHVDRQSLQTNALVYMYPHVRSCEIPYHTHKLKHTLGTKAPQHVPIP